MGERSRKWRTFFAQHPRCVFCGGARQAQTIEHYPPKAMFKKKLWPEGYEFPACDECNPGSRTDDLIVSILARVDPLNSRESDEEDQKVLEGLMSRLRIVRPGLLNQMIPSVRESRQANRQYGTSVLPGQTQQEASRALKIPPDVIRAVHVFAKKLGKAIYYKETSSIFPADGTLLMAWESNVELIRTGRYKLFDILQDMPGTVPRIERNRSILENQFAYKWTATGDLFVLQVAMGTSFALVANGSSLVGRLDEIVEMIAKGLRSAAVLQSPLIYSMI